MNRPQAEIERVVREVLAELGVRDNGSCATAVPAVPAAGQGQDAPATADGQLVLDCRVVTMSHVAGRLDGVKQLVVPPQAVVTPAVRDELYRRNIALTTAPATNKQAEGTRLTMIVVGRFDPTALATALRSNGVQSEPETMDCLIAATGRLAAEVAKPNTLGVLLTRHTAAALCLANRHRSVRAVLGPDAAAASVAAAAVGANVLVVDPTAAGFAQLKQAVLEFHRGGPRECPAVFRQQLT